MCLALLILSPLFFYKLGQSSLQNWDEAWYADIARNILKSGDLFNLHWAGFPFFDHPVFGFWMMALSYKILGVSELSAQLPSAIFGLGSVFIIFALGKLLFNRWVGFFSALALPSATWFLYRARSGNLDVFLETLFLLTIYLAFKATRNKSFLIPFTVSLACLFLTKTMVPLTILPALVIIFWKNSKITRQEVKLNIFIFCLIFGTWFVNQLAHQPQFLERYFQVGLPGVSAHSNFIDNFKQAKEFLHNGIGKWFWPGIISLLASVFLRQRRFLALTVFFLSFFIPFCLSQDGGIWHLVPLHPIMILAFFGFAYTIAEKFLKQKYLIILPLGLICLYFSFIQIKRSWNEFINVNPEISDEAILSKETAHYSENLYIEGSDFRPVAVFYSAKNVPQRVYKLDLPKLFANNKDFLMITYQNELNDQKIPASSYRIIDHQRDKILIFKEF